MLRATLILQSCSDFTRTGELTGLPFYRPAAPRTRTSTMDWESAYKHFNETLTSPLLRTIVISPDYVILSANPPAYATFTESIIGRRCHRLLHLRSSPCPGCPATRLWQNQGQSESTPHASREGDDAACRHADFIDNKDTQRAMVIIDSQDPSLESLEERLRRSNSFLKNLLHSSVDGVIAADKKGKILLFNDAASEISGYSEEEALTTLDIRDVYPDDGAYKIMENLRSDQYGGPGKLKSYQIDVLRKDGTLIPISLNAAIIYEGGRETATMGFFHDLREANRMKKELEKTQIQLLQSEKMASLGKLAAGVAHQLNNPLGGITLFARLMMEEYDLEEGARKDLNRILKDAERCRDTVKELLEFARQTRHEMRPLDINRAIARTLFLLENQTLFQNIEIVRQLSTDIPDVRGDTQQVNHMFMNIILNAAQAMEGRGTLSVSTRLSDKGDSVVIEIADTGPGIPPDVLPHIFEPFFTTKEEGQGTGIGLSLVYGIVENHEGKIHAVNNTPGGTRFVIELPLSTTEDEETPREK
jgi:PAS domain S-box-containing protein